MKISKNVEIAAITALGITALSLIALHFYNAAKNKKGDVVPQPTQPSKTGSGNAQPSNIILDTFPLVKGAQGNNVTALQNNLIAFGATFPATGYLGSMTEAFLNSLDYTLPLSKSDYDAIMIDAGVPDPTDISNFPTPNVGDKLYATDVVVTWKDCNNFTTQNAYKTFKNGDYIGDFLSKSEYGYTLTRDKVKGLPFMGSDNFCLANAHIGKVTIK